MKVIISMGHLGGAMDADGSPAPDSAGQYLRDFNPEFAGGIGLVNWTTDKDQAMLFRDSDEALKLYRSRPKCKPMRDDGRPNMPLTAFSVQISDL